MVRLTNVNKLTQGCNLKILRSVVRVTTPVHNDSMAPAPHGMNCSPYFFYRQRPPLFMERIFKLLERLCLQVRDVGKHVVLARPICAQWGIDLGTEPASLMCLRCSPVDIL